MIKFVFLLFTILTLFLSITNCQLENDDISVRNLNDHFTSPFDKLIMTSKHSNPFQMMNELLDLSIETTEAMLNSLNFDNLNNDFTTIEITIIESPNLSETKSKEDEFFEMDNALKKILNDDKNDTSKMTIKIDNDNESIQDQQYDPFVTLFQGCFEPDNENLLIFSPETLQSLYSSKDDVVSSKDDVVSSKDDVISSKDDVVSSKGDDVSFKDGDDVDEKSSFFMQSISDYLFSPLFVIFIAVAGFAAVIPIIISMIRGKKEKRYEYFVVHAIDDCQMTDLESAMCVKK
ncbi:hypothetical protein C2G38_2184609 [Gigaspora rosea]|uniref:Mid2 domain-containing protein n=1 Tax=Gigaspora rosea TaxID=44941 RepID=A0A397VEP1_9GLOM|nr:hypothetical protein C2G38_2184609 [Gigaspora rosea]